MENQAIKVGDTIGYIRQRTDPERFDLVTTTVDSIRIGKKSTKIYTKRFNPLDMEEVLFNTDWLRQNKNLILVREPFVCDEELLDRVQQWCEQESWKVTNCT